MNRFLSIVKNGIQRCLAVVDLELRSRKADTVDRSSLRGCLNHLKALGCEFETVLDGGAAYGDWSRECARTFPNAHFILVEPLEAYDPILRQTGLDLSGTVIRKVLGDREEMIAINVHPDLVGSSLHKEVEGANVDGVSRSVSMTTIDRLVDHRSGPCLIKLDLQGAEKLAIEGAVEVMTSSTDHVLVVETTLFDSFVDSESSIGALISFLGDLHYVLYDIFGFSYRPLDNALIQADCVFVHRDSPLRASHAYADATHRRRQFEQARDRHSERVRAHQTGRHR